MLQAIEINPASSPLSISGKIGILHSSVVHHLPDFSKSIQSCWIVAYFTKILENLTRPIIFFHFEFLDAFLQLTQINKPSELI